MQGYVLLCCVLLCFVLLWYLCMYVYMYVFLYVCICLFIYIYMYVCMYVCMYVRTCICMYVCTYMYVYIYIYVCIYLFICFYFQTLIFSKSQQIEYISCTALLLSIVFLPVVRLLGANHCYKASQPMAASPDVLQVIPSPSELSSRRPCRLCRSLPFLGDVFTSMQF